MRPPSFAILRVGSVPACTTRYTNYISVKPARDLRPSLSEGPGAEVLAPATAPNSLSNAAGGEGVAKSPTPNC